jgi:tetratricopeptide (TPR) repeat protein
MSRRRTPAAERGAAAALGLILIGAIVLAGCGGGRGLERRLSLPPLSPAEETAQAAAIPPLEARIREVVTETIRRLGERTGRPDPDPEAVRVEVQLGRLGGKPCNGRSAARTSGYGDSVTIGFCAEPFLSGDADPLLIPSHEAVHAYFRRQLSERHYRRIPAWLQEGLAIHLAGQTESKLARLHREEPESPEEKLTGLEAEESLNQYFEYGLALRFLDGQPGRVPPGGVEALVKRLLDGERPYDAIRAVTGLGRAAFLEAARADARIRLRAMVDAMPRDYREGMALVPRKGNKDIEGAMPRFERVLTAAGIDPSRGLKRDELTGNAGLAPVFALERWAGFSKYGYKHPAEAVAAHRLLLSFPLDSYGIRVDSVRYGLAQALEDMGNLGEALEEYNNVARHHHSSSFYQNVATYQIVQVLFKLGRYQETLEWIEAYRASGKRYDDRESMAYLKGLSLFHLGRNDEALRILRQLAGGEDGQPYVPQARKALSEIESGSLRSARLAPPI